MRSSEARLERVTRRLPTVLTTTALLVASALFCAEAVHSLDTGDRALIGACAAALTGALLLLLSYERLAVLAIGLIPVAIPFGYNVAKALKLSGYTTYMLSLTTSQVLLAATLLALIIVTRSRADHAGITMPPWPVTAYALLGFIPLIWSFAFILGLSGILAVWSAWTLEIVLLNLPWHTVKRCLLIFAGTTVIGVLVAIVGFVNKLGPLAGIYAKVYRSSTITESGMPLTPLQQAFLTPTQIASLGHRLNFNTNHPNAYAAFLLLACILGLTGIALSRQSRRRKVILMAAYLVVVLTGLVLTLSRTGAVAMAVSLLCLGALLFRNPRLRRILLACVLVGLVIAAIAPFLLNPSSNNTLVRRFATLSQASQDASFQVRMQLFRKLVPLLAHHPLGMGYGIFYDPALPRNLGLDFENAVNNGHDVHLDIAIESGIPSLLAYVAIWVLAAQQALRLYRGEGDAQLVGAFTLAGIAGLLTLGLTNAKPIEDPTPMLAMFMLFVLPYCARRELG